MYFLCTSGNISICSGSQKNFWQFKSSQNEKKTPADDMMELTSLELFISVILFSIK